MRTRNSAASANRTETRKDAAFTRHLLLAARDAILGLQSSSTIRIWDNDE
jgi:hypothetical protein